MELDGGGDPHAEFGVGLVAVLACCTRWRFLLGAGMARPKTYPVRLADRIILLDEAPILQGRAYQQPYSGEAGADHAQVDLEC